jgi:predicted transposase/invertase (TIGR01784 family)
MRGFVESLESGKKVCIIAWQERRFPLMQRLEIKKINARDSIVKKIFTSTEDGLKYLSKIVCKVLDISEEDVTFSLIHPDVSVNENSVNSEVDVALESNEMLVNVEVNSVRSRKNERKNNMYICHLVLRQTRNAEDYSKKFKKVYQINLNTYSVTNDDRFIVRSRLLDDKTYEEIHSFFEIYDINLAKILDMDYTKIMKDDESLEKLLYLLISDDERLIKKVYDGDDFMAKIIREVKNNSDDFDNLLRYNRDVIFDGNEKEEAFEDGLERGVKKGYKLGVEQTAKEMLQENCDVNLICRVTKLSLDEVERLKEELK